MAGRPPQRGRGCCRPCRGCCSHPDMQRHRARLPAPVPRSATPSCGTGAGQQGGERGWRAAAPGPHLQHVWEQEQQPRMHARAQSNGGQHAQADPPHAVGRPLLQEGWRAAAAVGGSGAAIRAALCTPPGTAAPPAASPHLSGRHSFRVGARSFGCCERQEAGHDNPERDGVGGQVASGAARPIHHAQREVPERGEGRSGQGELGSSASSHGTSQPARLAVVGGPQSRDWRGRCWLASPDA
jgi:hypothetical protein